MPSVTMPLPRMNNPAIPATVTFNFREMPALNGPGNGEVVVDDGLVADSGEWSLWQNLEGAFISAPTVAAWGEQQIDVFGISTDSQLYHKRWDGEAWGLWESLEGTCIYAPAAVARGADLVDVFAIGLDKQVYHKWWDGATWQGWEEVGGTCIHGLAATSWGPDRIDLFSVGTNSCLYHNCWDGETWQGWRPFALQDQMAWERSSTTIAAPAAVASTPGRIDLFVLGIDNQIYHAWGDGENWQGWENVGGPGMHGVAVTARGPGNLDLFTIGTDIEGTDNHMYHRAMVNGKWGNWDNLGGACISAPAAVALGEHRLDTFVVGTRSALFQKTWSEEGGGLGAQGFGETEKDAAKAKLDEVQSKRFDQYKARAKALIDNPAELTQGPFGVCGMATAVYFLLEYDLDKYIDLVKAIFDGKAFNGIPVGMKVIDGKPSDYSLLLYGREQQIRRMQTKVGTKWGVKADTKAPDPVWNSELDFDFIVSRSLGKLLRIKNPDLYQTLTKLSERFDPFFNYKGANGRIELFSINFVPPSFPAGVITNVKQDLDSENLNRLKAEIRRYSDIVLARTGYGIDLGNSTVTVTRPGLEWELAYDWPTGIDAKLTIVSKGRTLEFSSDRLQSFIHTNTSDNDADAQELIDLINAGPGSGDFLAFLQYINSVGLYKNKLGINLSTVALKTIIPGKTWELTYTLVDRKLLTVTTSGDSLLFFIDLFKQSHPLTSDGDLAFNEYGLFYLMKNVIGASKVDSYFNPINNPVDIVNATNTATGIARINQVFASSVEPKPFIIGMINGYTEWEQASKRENARTFAAAPVQEPKLIGKVSPPFTHIIGLIGKIEEEGAYYKVPVWTWAKEFTVRIKKELLSQYLYGYIYGGL